MSWIQTCSTICFKPYSLEEALRGVAAAGAAADAIPWAAHVEEFGHVRRASVALFRNMRPDACMRSGIASDKRFTVRAMAFITAGHLAHHLKILRERYL